MKSFVFSVNMNVPYSIRSVSILNLYNWLETNVPGRWCTYNDIIHFEYDEDATLFLLVYTGNENLKVVEV